MKKFDLQLDTASPDKGDANEGSPSRIGAKGLALNLDLMKKTDNIADMKEKLYDGYDASSSRK